MKKPDFIGLRSKRSLAPMDFYRFKHTTWVHRTPNQAPVWTSPYWVVGVSPFDKVITEDNGYVMHAGAPRFLARWTFNEEQFHEANDQKHFFDEDLGLLIYEISLLDEFMPDVDEWLLEAACAVAYSRGLICTTSVAEEC